MVLNERKNEKKERRKNLALRKEKLQGGEVLRGGVRGGRPPWRERKRGWLKFRFRKRLVARTVWSIII
jgi:hypothetical protein